MRSFGVILGSQVPLLEELILLPVPVKLVNQLVLASIEWVDIGVVVVVVDIALVFHGTGWVAPLVVEDTLFGIEVGIVVGVVCRGFYWTHDTVFIAIFRLEKAVRKNRPSLLISIIGLVLNVADCLLINSGGMCEF